MRLLKFLLDQHNRSLEELNLGIEHSLGETHSIPATGEQQLTSQQIKWLSARFRVSPEVFF